MRLSYRPTTILCSALLLSSMLACSDDGGSEVGDEAETGTTGDSSTADTEGESGESGSSSSTDDAETTVVETTVDESPDDADSDAETLDETTDADTSETKDTEETAETGNLGCGEIETLEDCQAAAGCQPVEGQPLVGGGLGSSPCLEASEFLGCIPEQICDDALTWFCMGNDSTYLVPNGCGPDGFDMCQGPPNLPMDCK